MPSALRAQVALIGLLAVMLIPIGTSSLRGLTHILTCQHRNDTPFTVSIDDAGRATIVGGAAQVTPGSTNEVCGGLVLDIRIGSQTAQRANVTLSITNNSEYGWRGSVQLRLDDTSIPIDIGKIDAGDAATDEFELRLQSGETYAVEGKLLIGP